MSSKCLIICSYNGPRHFTNGFTPSDMLRAQYQQLTKLKHSLDRIVIVCNDRPVPETELFTDVLLRNNERGSYGAWRDGYLQNPGFDWYFFLEDDQLFVQDNFDQKMIDLWEDDICYLANRYDEGLGGHASISNGMASEEILKQVDWNVIPKLDQYYSTLQVGWSKALMAVKPRMKDITEKYSTPFWTGQHIYWWKDTRPPLIIPIQMYES